MKYLIVEQDQCDYGVSIINITDCPLNMSEILSFSKIDSYDTPTILGTIDGKVDLLNNSNITFTDLYEIAKSKINKLFECGYDKPHKDITDRLYSKDECFSVLCENRYSYLGSRYNSDYCSKRIDNTYKKYEEIYKIFTELTPTPTNKVESKER